MGRRPGLLVIALCLLSLAGWRRHEEALATVWLPFLGAADALAPRPAPSADELPDAAAVAAAGAAWRDALMRRPAPASGRALLAVPVLAVDGARRELTVAVPPGAVRVDAPVTHHGRYVGSVCAWSGAGEVAERNGRAKVALPGHPRARPVAGVWTSPASGPPLHFLVQSDDGRALVTHPSRRLTVSAGDPVFTRDVRALGDDLPAGLLLGELQLVPRDRPGGGFDAQDAEQANLRPASRPGQLGTVVVEVTAGAELPCATLPARRLGLPAADGTRLRIDKGRLDGVAPGAWVVAGPRLVGLVGAVGPLSAQVERRAPPGLLYVEDGERLVPVTPELPAWPDDWRPRHGQRVWTGHRTHGALLVGTVDRVHATGFDCRPVPLPAAAEVTVVER